MRSLFESEGHKATVPLICKIVPMVISREIKLRLVTCLIFGLLCLHIFGVSIVFSKGGIVRIPFCIYALSSLQNLLRIAPELSVEDIVLENSRNPHVARLFVRTLVDKINLPYIQNQIEAFQYFARYLRGEVDESFDAMMHRMHNIAALGESGKRKYHSHEKTQAEYESDSAFPGIYRDEVVELLRDEDPEFSGGLKLKVRAIINLSAKELRTIESMATNPSRTNDRLRWRTPILGVDEKYWPWNLIREAGMNERNYPKIYEPGQPIPIDIYRDYSSKVLQHDYPSSDIIKHLIPLMANLMDKISGKIRRGNLTEQDKIDLIRDVALYYHLGISGHIFPKINNSLLMTQFNCVLIMVGYRGISHGSWDVYAGALGEEGFVPLVTDHVLKMQR